MTSPGSKVDEAATKALHSGGQLAMMVTKKRITRATLLVCIDELEQAVAMLKGLVK